MNINLPIPGRDSTCRPATRSLLALPLVTLALTFWSVQSGATVLSTTDVDDDAILTLNIQDTVIANASQQCGTLRIQVGTTTSFTAGDTIDLWLLEDDFIGNDLLWQTSFTVTAAEVLAGVDRTLGLVFTAPEVDGPGDTVLEIFAEALVNKDACGFLCADDNPITTPLSVTIAPVPVPAAVWLFGSALGLLGWIRRGRERR